MLHHLAIHQFALIEQLELELSQGLSVISGETGAGKSILLDALGLALGERAEAGVVRLGAEQAEISASFSLNAPANCGWSSTTYPAPTMSLVLRRIVTQRRPLTRLHQWPLSRHQRPQRPRPHLIEIHSQHAHQRLLQKTAPVSCSMLCPRTLVG